MDELKHRAGEKLEALHVAAKTAADNGKSRVHDVVHQTTEAIQKLREAFHDLWHHELIAEGRERAAAWAREAIKRIKEGAPPLSPVLLYEELVTLFHDRVWRRSVLIFVCGAALGGGAGVALGLRAARRGAAGPHCRALLHHGDAGVLLVEDAVAPGAGAGEVLVRVQAFSVCCVDRACLRGRGAALRGLLARPPVTVGRGFAGVVLDVGHGVDDLELGDEVWGCVSEWSGGAATELLTIRSTRVSKRPRGLAADAAASLPWDGGQALAALRQLCYTPDTCKGKRVALCGAAGGAAALQLLAAWGAHVTVLAPRHAALTLKDLGAHDFVDVEGARGAGGAAGGAWAALAARAARAGPWDAVLTCAAAELPPGQPDAGTVLKATAPRRALLDLRPSPFISDRLPTPLSILFATTFYSYRIFRWLLGCGTHTDWLEDEYRLREGLEILAKLVDAGTLAPVLDKVYLPQDFEVALAHACSEDAIGTTVIRFP
ncbi:NAD(P)H oxidoreductase RTN4IP1, mitochondrial-like [Anticarsia gemmatalis]|uniref:NAD(P)H oxidoreductase RTN4IP1, mitochondrial-like n=1 Tax=Anticarsia gemmatalis TaxID=129554 RepID=UPI003F772DB0